MPINECKGCFSTKLEIKRGSGDHSYHLLQLLHVRFPAFLRRFRGLPSSSVSEQALSGKLVEISQILQAKDPSGATTFKATSSC